MPFPAADKKVTFIEGITTMSGAGGAAMKVTFHNHNANSLLGWTWNSHLLLQCKHGKGSILLIRWRYAYSSLARSSLSKNRIRIVESRAI